MVFSSSDGKEVGRSGGGGSFGAGAGAGPSEEFVFVGGKNERKNEKERRGDRERIVEKK